MSDIEEIKPAGTVIEAVQEMPVRVLLLDDHPENLLLRSAILRKHGYITETADSVEEAEKLLDHIDIAVSTTTSAMGEFGTDVAAELRDAVPQVPIIILSATLERCFGGVEDMHLLKGYSSVDDLLAALSSLEAKRRGSRSSSTPATSSTPASTWPWATTWCSRSWTPTATGNT